MIGSDPSGIDLVRVGCFSAVLQGRDPMQHVLLTDGLRRLRLDVRGGTVLEGPVTLRVAFDGLNGIHTPLMTLRRLVGLSSRGTMPLSLFPADRRVARWLMALRADDLRRAGGSQRDVAETLFGADRARDDWSGPSDYLRSQVRRLLGFATRMRGGGWRDLLRSGYSH